MAGETTLASLGDSINAVIISKALGQAVAIPLTYNFAVYVKDISGEATNTWRSTMRPDIEDAIAIAEAADVTDDEMTDEKEEISVGTIARSVLVTYEVGGATILGRGGELAEGTRQVTMACRRKIDSLLWTDQSPNLENTSGDNTVGMTYAQFVSFAMEAQVQWKDNQPQGSVLRAFLHSGPFRHLVNDMITSEASIFAATFGSQNAGAALAAMGNGGMKNIAGVETLVTDRIPAADTSGKGNVFCLVGGETGSCFGLAVKWGVKPEMRPTEKKLADRMIGSARVGVGILRQEYGLQAITAAV